MNNNKVELNICPDEIITVNGKEYVSCEYAKQLALQAKYDADLNFAEKLMGRREFNYAESPAYKEIAFICGLVAITVILAVTIIMVKQEVEN